MHKTWMMRYHKRFPRGDHSLLRGAGVIARHEYPYGVGMVWVWFRLRRTGGEAEMWRRD